MCGVKRISNLDPQIEHRFNLQRLAIYHVLERLAFQKLHCDEGSPIGLVDFVNGADVRMVQGGRGLGLALKTSERSRLIGEFVGKQLQYDVATQLEVFRFVYHTHAPAADLADDAVMGNRLSHGLGGRGHWREW